MMPPVLKAIIRRLATASFVIGVVAVAVLSLVPLQAIPGMDVSDKAQHLIAYLCLALAGGIAFPGRRSLLVMGLGLVLFGVSLELAQSFIPGRFASVVDAAANTLGVALGLTLAWVAGSRAGLSA